MSTSTRVLILAAGSGTRWGNYLGVPKHLVEIEGEVLLGRTIRQFKQYSDEVVVVGPDRRYALDAPIYVPTAQFGNEMDKFASSFEMWSDDRTILVYGDVYFTDEAVATIMTDDSDWKYFCRSTPSEITGKNCKEIFAIGVSGARAEWMKDAITKLMAVETSTGGWTLFRELTLGTTNVAKTDRAMFATGNHVEIDDWTEDFDYPADLDNWLSLRLLNSESGQ